MESSLSEVVAEPEVREPLPARPAWERLEEQIDWYDRKSQSDQRVYKAMKVCQIVTAAAMPFAASISAPIWVAGGGGALIVVIEGIQQLMQYQQNWITYRATCERLKHEKFLYLSHAGPYAAALDPDVLLAERVESLVSQEHAAWAANREEVGKKVGGEG
ncbi:MAG: DUF4231 domain-containing protein [Actinobacteria bacterium]|nr:MAG: DUF4231 domain-containing protein [Actinomycetota bacterium]